MKSFFLSTLFTLSLFGNIAYAQGFDQMGSQIGATDSSGNVQALSGDSLCGSSAKTVCKPAHVRELFARLIPITVAALTLVIFFYIVWFLVDAKIQEAKGNSKAFGEAKGKLFNLLTTFILAVLLLSGFFLVILRGVGVKEDFLTIFNLFFSVLPIEHAYAAELPNPLGSNNIYDIGLGFLSAFIRFFVYPLLIFFWVLAGFKFVAAQGNPKEITTAKKWLWTTFIITLVIFSAQGFLFGIRGTINTILGGKATTQTVTNSTSAPDTPTSPGAACEKDGMYGQRGADGTCYYGGVRGGSTAPAPTDPKTPGTTCTKDGFTGQYGNDGVCYYGGTR